MKTRKLSLRKKIVICITIVSIFCCMIAGVTTFLKASTMLTEKSRENAKGIAQIAAAEIDGDAFGNISSEEDADRLVVYDQLYKYLSSSEIRYIYAMRLNGERLEFVVDVDNEENADTAAYGEAYKMSSVIQKAFDGKVSVETEPSSDKWGTFYSAFAPIFNSRNEVVGIVGCDVSIRSVEKNITILRKQMKLIGFACCVISFIVAWMLSNVVTRNMKVLYNKVIELNKGDGDLTQKLEISSGDEMEKIAEEFNIFITQIQGLMTNVARATGILKDSSSHVNTMAEKSNRHIGKMNESLEMLSAEMEESSASVTDISSSLEKVVKEIKTLDQQAADTSSEALKVSSTAMQSKAEIQVANERTKDIVAKFQEEMDAIAEEIKEIEKIDEVVGEILKIANTTKVLAQNTYIEAARAGESGKGFSVIAGSMSKLNDQISDLVKTIRESNNSVKMMVTRLVENANNMSHYLQKDIVSDYADFVKIGQEYSNNMAEMSSILKRFSSITKDASQNISLIGENIRQINEVINDATFNISEVHGYGIDLKQEIDSLVDIAENNTAGSEQMANEVGKYRY